MPSHDSNLFIDAGALLAFSPGLDHAVHQDHQVLQLYAQLAADKQHSRDAESHAWHDTYIAALKHFGMSLPRREHRWFDADVSQAKSLALWLTPPVTEGVDEPAWLNMLQAMQRMAEGVGNDEVRQLLHTQAVQHCAACSSLNLLLVHVATDGAVDLWFARLQTRELIERNLFTHVFAGNALVERIEIFHHAGTLSEGYVAHRAKLASQVAERRQGLLLAVADATRRQP